MSLASIPPIRALPVPVALVRHEDRESLLSRLAAVNHLNSHDLRDLLPRLTGTNTGSRHIDTAALAALAGHPVHRLRDLLPDHRYTRFSEQRAACRRCLAGKGITAPVFINAPNHQPVCRRHHRWLPTASRRLADQHDLRLLPEILTAQRRHAALVRRHGPTDHLADAYGHARHIVARWDERGDWNEHRRRRLGHYLDDVDHWHIPHHAPLAVMARYPDTVSLTTLLADPRWVTLAIRAGAEGLGRFHAELRRRLKIPYQPYTSHDPLAEWRRLERETS